MIKTSIECEIFTYIIILIMIICEIVHLEKYELVKDLQVELIQQVYEITITRVSI